MRGKREKLPVDSKQWCTLQFKFKNLWRESEQSKQERLQEVLIKQKVECQKWFTLNPFGSNESAAAVMLLKRFVFLCYGLEKDGENVHSGLGWIYFL